MSIMKNFITTQNWSRSELQDILDFAIELKNKPHQPLLKNKSIAMLFFNPSLRTKTSFEVGISELSGTCLLYTSPSPRDLSTSRMPSSA